MDCAYDLAATYAENFQRGPRLSSPPNVSVTPENERVEFLGNPQLIRNGERNALALRAISQSCVVNGNFCLTHNYITLN